MIAKDSYLYFETKEELEAFCQKYNISGQMPGVIGLYQVQPDGKIKKLKNNEKLISVLEEEKRAICFQIAKLKIKDE